jgi:hypothetical protein
LVGIQVPDAAAFRVFADALGCAWVVETENPIYRLFLRPPREPSLPPPRSYTAGSRSSLKAPIVT